MLRLILPAVLLLYFVACTPPPHQRSAFVDEAAEEAGVQVIVEIPAGSVRAAWYNPQRQLIEADTQEVAFLPFPGNLGFVPSTHMPHQEEAFAPVRVMVLGERMEAGDDLSVLPFAAVVLRVDKKPAILVLGVPADPALRNLEIRDLSDLHIRYPGVKEGLEAWLRQWKGGAPAEVLDWKDGAYALRFIRASLPKVELGKNN
jgi:inorganic pyrophosphatase